MTRYEQIEEYNQKISQGHNHIAMEEYCEALSLFEEAIKLYSGGVEAYLGAIYAVSENLSIEDLNTITELSEYADGLKHAVKKRYVDMDKMPKGVRRRYEEACKYEEKLIHIRDREINQEIYARTSKGLKNGKIIITFVPIIVAGLFLVESLDYSFANQDISIIYIILIFSWLMTLIGRSEIKRENKEAEEKLKLSCSHLNKK